jgi:small GTP-binding protein
MMRRGTELLRVTATGRGETFLSTHVTSLAGTPAASPLGYFSWTFGQAARDPYYILVIIYIFYPYFSNTVVGDPVRGQARLGAVTPSPSVPPSGIMRRVVADRGDLACLLTLRSEVISRKICILGDFAVGKTSLVDRFLGDRFFGKYHASIGAKVDTKDAALPDGSSVRLAVWDIAGTDAPTEVFLRYLRGSSGYLLVADGTRAESLSRALELRDAVESHLAVLPFVGLINKADLTDQQEIDDGMLAPLRKANETWLRTSAFDGANVERAFYLLLRAMEQGE